MAINIQNIVAALEAKVAAATSTTETQELIVIIKSIKAAGQQTVVTYGDVPNLPTASVDNAGNLAYVAAVGKIYYSNGTTWTEVGSGSSGGGGGTAYDQDLNTTDDVVFNSALVGDVSIVGNTIGGVDAYGLNGTLVVDGGLEVKYDNQTSYNINAVNYSVGGQYTSFTVSNPSTEIGNLLLALNAGDEIVVSFIDNEYSVTRKATMVIFSVSQQSSDIVVSSLNNAVTYTQNSPASSGLAFGYFPGSFLSNFILTTGSSIAPLSVTESGVNVEGTFTVNGLPIAVGSGSSYDQDLNTTDDVVFNSVLVGDVSIIGNTVAATDSYGNIDTLTIASDLSVKVPGPVATYTPDNFYLSYYDYQNQNELRIVSPPNSAVSDAVLALKQGDVVTVSFNDIYIGSITAQLTVVSAVQANDNVDNKFIYFNNIVYIIGTPPSGSYVTNDIPGAGGPASNFILSLNTLVTPISVTEYGVAITGDLTLDDNTTTPTNTSTVVKWAKIIVAGQVYFTPLYQ